MGVAGAAGGPSEPGGVTDGKCVSWDLLDRYSVAIAENALRVSESGNVRTHFSRLF